MSMDRKEVKEYLGRAYRVDRMILSKLNQIQSLNDLATRATSVISDMPGSATRNVHKKEDVIVKILTLEEEIHSEVSRLVDIKRETMEVIRKVKDPELQLLLEERYLCFLTWEDIAADMNCTVRNVLVLHGKALNEVQIPG